jgi:hypothetical protein
LVCRLLHSPARRPPYGRPETSRLLKVDHYILDVRIKMHSGAYASSRQDTDYAEAGGGQEFRPRVCYQRFGCPDTGVRTSRFEPLSNLLGPLVVESLPLATTTFKAALRSFELPGGIGRGTGASSAAWSGVCRTLGELEDPKLPLTVPTRVRLAPTSPKLGAARNRV